MVTDEIVDKVLSCNEEQLLKKIFHVKGEIEEIRERIERQEIELEARRYKLFMSDEVQEIEKWTVQRFKLDELERDARLALSRDKKILSTAKRYLDLYERVYPVIAGS